MFGILNINKPSGITSRDAVNRVVRCLPRKTKVGHAGTLDPIAQGVLVICVGPATRLIPYIHQHAKGYLGVFQLGQSSPTEDIEGEITHVALPAEITQESIQSRVPDFLGEIEQVPPRFSAVKVNGKRAYDVARSGQDFELEAKRVRIHRLELTYEKPQLTMQVECGTGTYIRSLGRDIARSLGTEAVMNDLARISVGPYRVQDSVELDSLTKETLVEHLQSPLGILQHLPQFVADSRQVDHLRHGRVFQVAEELLEGITPETPLVILDSNNELVALGVEKRGQLAPHIVFPDQTT